MLIHRTYQERGYCRRGGYQRLRDVLALCGELYNAALQERRDAWRLSRASMSLAGRVHRGATGVGRVGSGRRGPEREREGALAGSARESDTAKGGTADCRGAPPSP